MKRQFLLTDQCLEAFVFPLQLAVPVVCSVSCKTGTTRFQKLSFPGVNQAFVDAVLPSCLSHTELAAEDSQHDLLFGVGRPLLSLFSHDFPPVCPTLASGRTFLEGFPGALPRHGELERENERLKVLVGEKELALHIAKKARGL